MTKKNPFLQLIKKASATFVALMLLLQMSFIPETKASDISTFISGLSTQPSNITVSYIHSGNQVFPGDTLTFVMTTLGTFTLNSVSAPSCSTSSQSSTGITVTCTSAGFVSPSYSVNTGAGPSGGISINATSVNFPAENAIVTKSVTVTSASAPTIGSSLSPSSVAHTHVNPHDQVVVATCNLNGGSYVSFSVDSDDVIDEPGAVGGSGDSRTLTFTVRNASMAPTTISADITCENSVGIANSILDFEYTNEPPVIDNPEITVPITRGSFNTQVSISDPDGDDDIVAGVTASHPDLTAQLFTPGNPATLDLTFDFNNNLVKNVTINNISDDHVFIPSAQVTVTIPDTAATVSLDESDILAHFGISSLSQLNAGVITANPGTADVGISLADADGVDASQAISCTVVDAPPGVTADTTGAPFTGSGDVANSPYVSALTFDANTFTPGYLTVECSMFGGSIVFSDELQFGSGGRRREAKISVLFGTDLDQIKEDQEDEQEELTGVSQALLDDETSFYGSAKDKRCVEYTLLTNSEGEILNASSADVTEFEEVQKAYQISVDASFAMSTLRNFSSIDYSYGLFEESKPDAYVFEEGFKIEAGVSKGFLNSFTSLY